MTEKQFQAQVVALARELGWKVVHIPNRGRATSVYDNRGFPDLLLAKPGRILFFELKAETGHTSQTQQEWAEILHGSHFVLYPSDYDRAVEILVSRS